MRLKNLIVAAVLFFGFASMSAAQSSAPLSLSSERHYGDGVSRIFEFEIVNSSDRSVTTRGRLVVINVYDASLPITLPVRDFTIPAKGTVTAVVRWDDAPLIGQIRTLLVLNDGQYASLIENRTFWILPLFPAAIFAGLVALMIGLAFAVMRLPKLMKEHIPANTIAYIVEYDDSVVSLSNRYDATWQDIVKANRLKPPYELKPGTRVFIPKHELRHAEPEKGT